MEPAAPCSQALDSTDSSWSRSLHHLILVKNISSLSFNVFCSSNGKHSTLDLQQGRRHSRNIEISGRRPVPGLCLQFRTSLIFCPTGNSPDSMSLCRSLIWKGAFFFFISKYNAWHRRTFRIFKVFFTVIASFYIQRFTFIPSFMLSHRKIRGILFNRCPSVCP